MINKEDDLVFLWFSILYDHDDADSLLSSRMQ